MTVQAAPELLTVSEVLEQLSEETRAIRRSGKTTEIETAFTALLAGQQVNLRIRIEWVPRFAA